MNRTAVVTISVLTVTLFAGLVYYGWTNRWGGPSESRIEPPSELAMPARPLSLKLEPGDFEAAVWNELPPLTVRLLHQVTIAPRGKNLVPDLQVRAFHNGKEAYFLCEWKDERESRVHELGEFPDACAVAFSLAEEPPKASIMMGFESTVNIWQWKADLDAQIWKSGAPEGSPSPNVFYTYEKPAAFPTRTTAPTSACQDLLSGRPGTVTVKDKTSLTGRGQWRDGRWRVILKRALSAGDPEAAVQLKPGKHHIAFAVWNGEKGDRGSRKSISEWVVLNVQAAAVTAARAGRKAPEQHSARRAASFSFLPTADAGTVAPDPKLPKPRVITIKAKRFQYNPSEITLQKGERVTFRLESLDVTHGLYLDGYGIDIKANPTQVGTATFVADKTGRFTFRCSETCGEFHPYMIGYLTVEPNTRFHVFVAVILVTAAGIAGVFVFRSTRKKGAA